MLDVGIVVLRIVFNFFAEENKLRCDRAAQRAEGGQLVCAAVVNAEEIDSPFAGKRLS